MIDFSINFEKSQFKYSIFIFLTFFILFSQVAYAISNEKAIRNHIKHANTYFWFGMGEKGNMRAFQGGITHLDKAEALLNSSSLSSDEVIELKFQIDALRIDFKNQMEVHFDTLYGVFPLVRLLAPSLFADALAAGTFELVDDPAVMASTAAGYRLSKDVFQKWSSRPQLDVVVNSLPVSKALESEILYIFNSSAKFFVHNFHEVTDALSPVQIEQFQANKFTPEITKRLCDSFGISNLLVVTVLQKDVVDSDHYYILEGKIYNVHRSEPTHSFSNMGFSRDRNAQLRPIIVSNAVLLLTALIGFVLLTRLRSVEWGPFPTVIVAPLTAFLIGRFTPWFLIPVLSSFAPMPETLAILAFWWPCMVGAVIFLAPALLYQIVSVRIRTFSDIFDNAGRTDAVFAAIAMGVCAYLASPLFLFLEANAINILLPLALCGGISMFLLGYTLDLESLLFHAIAIPVVVLLALGAALTHLTGIYLWICCGVAIIPAALIWIPDWRIRREKAEDRLTPAPVDLPSDVVELEKRSNNPPYLKFETFREASQRILPLIELETCWLALSGPTGAGKTATANAIIDRASKQLIENGQKLVLLKGECPENSPDEIRQVPPYAPFQKALARYFKVNVLLSREGQCRQIDAALDGMFELIVPISGLLSPPTKEFSKKASSKKEVYTSVVSTIRKLAGKNTVVLFIDDVQWIDSASSDLLSFLMDEFNPGGKTRLLILLTSRKKDGILSNMKENILTVHVPNELQRKDILVSCLGLTKEVAEIIVQKVGMGKGGLFWLLRVVSHLAEKGLFQRTEEGFKWSQEYKGADNLPIPDGLFASLENQLEKISEYRSILECAACLGLEFNAGILAESLAASRLEILQALDRIEDETGILFDVRESDDVYAFSSSFILEILRKKFRISGQGPKASNVPQLIREYHAKLAICLEKTLANSSNKLYEVAMHYYAAGAAYAQKAFDYCLKASHAARSEFLFGQARGYINMAAESDEILGRNTRFEKEYLLINCDESHIQGLHHQETATEGLSYINDRHSDIPISIIAAVARSCYDAGLDKGNQNMFEETARLGRLMVKKNESSLENAEGYHFLGISLSKMNRADEGKENLQVAIDLLDPLPEEDVLAQALLSRVANSFAELLSYGSKKDPSKAKSLFELSVKIKERSDIHDLPGLARSHGGLGRIALESNPPDYSVARYHLRTDLELSEKIGDVTGQAMMHSFLGRCDKVEGKLEEATEHYRLSFELAERIVDKFFALIGLLECFAKIEQFDRLDHYGEQLFRLAKEKHVPSLCGSDLQKVIELCQMHTTNKWLNDLENLIKKVD